VRIEIEAALQRGIRVIPVLVDGATMPRREDLPDSLQKLRRRQAIEISHNRFNSDVERLTQALSLVEEELRQREAAEAERTARDERERQAAAEAIRIEEARRVAEAEAAHRVEEKRPAQEVAEAERLAREEREREETAEATRAEEARRQAAAEVARRAEEERRTQERAAHEESERQKEAEAARAEQARRLAEAEFASRSEGERRAREAAEVEQAAREEALVKELAYPATFMGGARTLYTGRPGEGAGRGGGAKEAGGCAPAILFADVYGWPRANVISPIAKENPELTHTGRTWRRRTRCRSRFNIE
jgi:colicin import membrane protein